MARSKVEMNKSFIRNVPNCYNFYGHDADSDGICVYCRRKVIRLSKPQRKKGK